MASYSTTRIIDVDMRESTSSDVEYEILVRAMVQVKNLGSQSCGTMPSMFGELFVRCLVRVSSSISCETRNPRLSNIMNLVVQFRLQLLSY